MCVASGVLLSVLCVISNVQTLRQLRGSVSRRGSRLSGKRGYSGGLAPAKRENGFLRLCVLHYRARSCTRRVALEGALRNDNAHARRSPTSPTANDESGTDVTVHLPRARRGKATTARLPMRPTKRETGTAPNSATRASRGPCARGRATHAPQGHTGNTQGHTGTHARAGTSDATRVAPSARGGR